MRWNKETNLFEVSDYHSSRKKEWKTDALPFVNVPKSTIANESKKFIRVN